MNNKLIMSVLSVLMLIVMTGCSNGVSNQPNTAQTLSYNEYRDLFQTLSYNEYRDLFQTMSNIWKPTGFVKVESSDQVNVIAVEKEFSFGKRQFLTLTGEQTNQETQERILYVQDNSRVVGMVELIYLDAPLGDHLVFWSSRTSEYLDKEKVHLPFHENMLSYQNVLVKITTFSKDHADMGSEPLYQLTKEVVKFLNHRKDHATN